MEIRHEARMWYVHFLPFWLWVFQITKWKVWNTLRWCNEGGHFKIKGLPATIYDGLETLLFFEPSATPINPPTSSSSSSCWSSNTLRSPRRCRFPCAVQGSFPSDMESAGETCEGLIYTLIFSTPLISKLHKWHRFRLTEESPPRVMLPHLLFCAACALQAGWGFFFSLWNGNKEFIVCSGLGPNVCRYQIFISAEEQIAPPLPHPPTPQIQPIHETAGATWVCSSVPSHPLLIHLGADCTPLFFTLPPCLQSLFETTERVLALWNIYTAHTFLFLPLPLSFFSPSHTGGAKSPAARERERKKNWNKFGLGLNTFLPLLKLKWI